MIFRWRCTALVSIETTLLRVLSATYLGNAEVSNSLNTEIFVYRMLLSLLLKNLPRMFIAMTRKPVSASISSTVNTVSYKIEFPTFFDESVFVATLAKPVIRTVWVKEVLFTCASISFIVSLACSSPFPSILSNLRIFTWRNGSVIPDTSCSGL